MAVLEEHPGAVLHGGGDKTAGVNLLPLSHGDVATLDVLFLGQGHDVLCRVRTHRQETHHGSADVGFLPHFLQV